MQDLLRTLEQKTNPKSCALLVIDMQNDLCNTNGSFAKMGVDVTDMAAVVGPVLKLTEAAKSAGVLTIYTQVIDTYMPAISPAYYEANLSFFEEFLADEAEDTRDAPWITPGFGEDFVSPLEPTEGDVVIRKHRYGAFANTKLDQILRSNAIQSVIVSGVMTEVCVESTARAALDHDYYVIIPEDCTATIMRHRKSSSLESMGEFFATITSLKSIQLTWEGAVNSEVISESD